MEKEKTETETTSEENKDAVTEVKESESSKEESNLEPNDSTKKEETKEETKLEDKNDLGLILDRIKTLESERDEWKSYSRKHEKENKEFKRKEIIRGILSENNLPESSSELLTGENIDEIKAKAVVLSQILNTKSEEKKTFSTNPFQGVKSEVPSGSAFQDFLASKLNN